MATDSDKSAIYLYRLAFGNTITEPATDVPKLVLEQGVRKEFKDSNREYYLTLGGVKVNRKIYQPLEIEVELTFEQKRNNINPHDFIPQAPSFSDVTALLMRRMVTVDLVDIDRSADSSAVLAYNNKEYNIAKNCFVYELDPQLKRNSKGTQMFVKLNIFSMDKLMTLNKYSKAYVARKLGSEILQPESLQFGAFATDVPLVQTYTDTDALQFLMYKDGTETREFIQPYLVQYNESFYDFLVRTSNRCGEFLYFEDGKLTLGVPGFKPKENEKKTVEEIMVLDGYETVTMQNISSDPMTVLGYARDSVKDKNGEISELNQTVIKKDKTGYPTEAFPGNASSNSELAVDEYIFPLFKDKFSKTTREMFYYGDGADIAMFQAFKAGKTIFSNELDTVAGVLASLAKATIVDHGVQSVLSAMQQSTVNKEKAKRYIEPYKEKMDQYDGGKTVEFASLATAGWTTLNYYNDIRKYEEAQQRQIVCVNMGTTYAHVKLGQKIKIKDVDGIYVVIQIQQVSEEAWIRDYEKYNRAGSDKFTGNRSLKIYAIPTYKKDEKDTVGSVVPPVQPVPVIRKSGPQTAFVTANEDPKFQGRVRIAYPWQSEASGKKAEVKNADQKLTAIDTKLDDIKAKQKEALENKLLYDNYIEELKKYVNASEEERKQMIEAKTGGIETLKGDVRNLEKDIKTKNDEITQCDNSLLTGQLSPADTEKTQNKKALLETQLTMLKAERDKKAAQLEKQSQFVSDMIAAAKEHDAKNGKVPSYQNLEVHNTVIKKYKAASDAHNNKYREAVADQTRLDKEKEIATADLTQKVKEYQASIQDMSSPWVRIATPMATPGGGSFYRPRIGDEVLVNFDSDNVERPYVVGSLFSKNVLTPDERYYRKQSPELQWKDVSMAISSPNGHHISFTDPGEGGSFVTNLISPGLGFYGSVFGFDKFAKGGKDLAGGIHIGDRYGLYEIEMKSHQRAIEIKSPLGTVSINAFTGITISAPNGDVKIKGKNITLEAGNKVTINSGTNLPLPDFGTAPAGKTKAADITKAVIGGVTSALVDQFVSSVVDLSTIRHIIEVFVRPVDGTTLIKSRKFLKLEAGLGKATVTRDKYKNSTKTSQEIEQKFFIELIKRIRNANDTIKSLFNDYESQRQTYSIKHILYQLKMGIVLKDIKDMPDVGKWALDDAKNNGSRLIVIDPFIGKMKDSFVLDGRTYDKTDEEKFEAIKPCVEEFYKAGLTLFKTTSNVRLAEKFVISEGEYAWLDEAVQKTAKEGWIGNYLTEWQNNSEDLFNSLLTMDEKDTLFGLSKQVFFRRAFLLLFLKNAYDAPENKKNEGRSSFGDKVKAFLSSKPDATSKYFYIGYKEADVTNQASLDLSVDYWWKRQVHVIDRYSQNSLLRTIWDGTAGKLLNDIYDNTAGLFKKETDRQVWGSEKEGQILFSDKEDSTLSFEGEGLHRETDANQGNIAHLKWMMRDL